MTLDNPVTPLEQDCAQLHVLDLSYPISFAFVAVFIMPKVLAVALKLLFASVNLVLSLLTLLYSTCLALDKSTLKTLDKQVEQNTLAIAKSILPVVTIKDKPTRGNVDRKNANLARVPTSGGTRKRLRFRNR
jgi:uncharacterized membrane protein (Fun14 family)